MPRIEAILKYGQPSTQVMTLEAADPQRLAAALRERMGLQAEELNGSVRLAEGTGRDAVAAILQAFADDILALHVGKPTLEDVFIARTGHRFRDQEAD